jgi:hypothetical protein
MCMEDTYVRTGHIWAEIYKEYQNGKFPYDFYCLYRPNPYCPFTGAHVFGSGSKAYVNTTACSLALAGLHYLIYCTRSYGARCLGATRLATANCFATAIPNASTITYLG